MATTTAQWTRAANGHNQLRLRVLAERQTHNADDIAANRTRVRVRLFWEATVNWQPIIYTFSPAGTARITSSCGNVNATSPVNTATLTANQSRTIIDEIVYIPHNADGTRSNVTFRGTFPRMRTFTGGTWVGQDFTPDTGNSTAISFITIPRQSTINANPNFTAFSGRLTVNMTRHSTNHSNDIRIAVRNTTATNTTDAFDHPTFTQLIGWTHFTGNTFNFNMTQPQLTTLFSAMNGAATRQVIVETRTRNGTANNAALIGTTQVRRGTVTAPNANTATLSNVTFNSNATSGNIPFTINRVSAGTGQEGSLETYLRLRNGTTNLTGWTTRLDTTTGNISLTAANLDTIRSLITNGRSITTIDAQVWTTYNAVQVRTTSTTSPATITFNLADLLPTTVTNVPSGSNGSLGSTTFIQGRSNARIDFPANFAPISNGWENTTFQARRGTANVGTAMNPQTTAGSMTVTGLNTPGSEDVGIRVTDTNSNTRDSMHIINVIAYSAPTFVPSVVRHETMANTVVISGTGWRQAITGTGDNARTNQLELRTRHRTRTIGGNWSGWTGFVTRILVTNATVNLAATNITIPDNHEVEVEFEHRDFVNTNWIRTTATASVVMPTLFVGSGNGRVGIGVIPNENNSFEIGEGIKFELGGVSVREHITNQEIHVTSDEREQWNRSVHNVDEHITNQEIHLTSNERQHWNRSVYDTGWLTIPANAYDTHFEPHPTWAGGLGLRYRRIGNVVNIIGAVRTTSTFPATGVSTFHNVLTTPIPEGFRPTTVVNTIQPSGTGDAWVGLRILSNGRIELGHIYRPSQGTWWGWGSNTGFEFNSTYFIN